MGTSSLNCNCNGAVEEKNLVGKNVLQKIIYGEEKKKFWQLEVDSLQVAIDSWQVVVGRWRLAGGSWQVLVSRWQVEGGMWPTVWGLCERLVLGVYTGHWDEVKT